MSSPNETHHNLSEFIDPILKAYFVNKGCKVYRALFDLYLFDRKKFVLFPSSKTKCENVFIPDLMAVCDKNKRKSNGVYGAPDLVVEIISK
ncbi:MAG: Uma2 family endonuclease [Clostridiales bacterium]|nr:Uma2 family endonuclease [Clostridiales bacterium]